MSVLVIIFCRKVFKKKFDTQNAISIIRWLMICYSILILVYFLLLILLPPTSNIFFSSILDRATGPYSFAFWLMALGPISPFILFFKKLSNKTYLILALTIFMNFGWLMESLVIHISIIEREYSLKAGGFKEFERELMIALQGIIFGVLSMVIGNLPFFRKKTVD